MDSRRRVAAAIVAALCCGAFSAAATAATTLTVATVEAEQMQLPAGASITTDRAASGGEAVQLTTIGSSLTSSLTLSRAVTGIKLVAHGTRCQSGWPAVQVSLDGRSLLRANVSSTSWQGFSAAVSTPAGSHTLAITDTATNACRTLSVDDITFTGPRYAGSDYLPVSHPELDRVGRGEHAAMEHDERDRVRGLRRLVGKQAGFRLGEHRRAVGQRDLLPDLYGRRR